MFCHKSAEVIIMQLKMYLLNIKAHKIEVKKKKAGFLQVCSDMLRRTVERNRGKEA